MQTLAQTCTALTFTKWAENFRVCSGSKELHFKLSALEKTQPFAFSYKLGPPYYWVIEPIHISNAHNFAAHEPISKIYASSL